MGNMLGVGLLALSLLLATAKAWAVGLGEIQSSSALGEPLQATIEVLGSNGQYDADELRVRKVPDQEASGLGFELVAESYGIKVAKQNTPSGVAIQLFSRNPINEPFLNFLIELEWPNGSVLREYTLLLDLPSAVAPAQVSAPKPSAVSPGPVSVVDKKPAPKNQSRPAAAAAQASSSSLMAGEKYLVRSGDSLSRIAQRWRAGTGESLGTVTQWLFENNPHAFSRGDINRLKAGSRLTLPARDGAPIALAPAVEEKASSRPAAETSPAVDTPAPQEPAAEPVVDETQKDSAAKLTESLERAKSIAAKPDAAQAVDPQLRLSMAELMGEGDVDHMGVPDNAVTTIKSYIDSTREVIDQLRRDNADLRKQVEAIENSEYLAMMQELVQLQSKQLEELKLANRELTERSRTAAAGNATPAQTAVAPSSAAIGDAASQQRDSIAQLDAGAVVPSTEEDESRTMFWIIALGMPLLALALFIVFLPSLRRRKDDDDVEVEALSIVDDHDQIPDEPVVVAQPVEDLPAQIETAVESAPPPETFVPAQQQTPVTPFEDVQPSVSPDLDDDLDELFNEVVNDTMRSYEKTVESDLDAIESIREKLIGYTEEEDSKNRYIVSEDVDDLDEYLKFDDLNMPTFDKDDGQPDDKDKS